VHSFAGDHVKVLDIRSSIFERGIVELAALLERFRKASGAYTESAPRRPNIRLKTIMAELSISPATTFIF